MIKVGRGKDKVIVQSGSDEDTATVATLKTAGSLEMKSSQGDKGDEAQVEKRQKSQEKIHRVDFTNILILSKRRRIW